MKQHWAPWRMAFILEKKTPGCIFCTLPAEKRHDRQNLILYRGKHCFVILNKYPYNNGHLMVVPYRHTCDLSALKKAEYAEMMSLGAITTKVLEESMAAQGHNLGMNLGAAGGAGIRDHLHLHIVPRWLGDSNFMPVLSNTKVLIEYLDETYNRLAPLFKKKLSSKNKKK